MTRTMNTGLSEQVSLFPVLNLPTILSPTTPRRPWVDLFSSRADRVSALISRCAGLCGILGFTFT